MQWKPIMKMVNLTIEEAIQCGRDTDTLTSTTVRSEAIDVSAFE